jgi:hypothetical protein
MYRLLSLTFQVMKGEVYERQQATNQERATDCSAQTGRDLKWDESGCTTAATAFHARMVVALTQNATAAEGENQQSVATTEAQSAKQ